MTDIVKKLLFVLIKKLINLRKTINNLDNECDKLLLKNEYLITNYEKLSNIKYDRFIKKKHSFKYKHGDLFNIINILDTNDELFINYYAYNIMNEYKKNKSYIIYLNEFINDIKNSNESLRTLSAIHSELPDIITPSLTNSIKQVGISDKTVGVITTRNANNQYNIFSPSSTETEQIGGGIIEIVSFILDSSMTHIFKHIMLAVFTFVAGIITIISDISSTIINNIHDKFFGTLKQQTGGNPPYPAEQSQEKPWYENLPENLLSSNYIPKFSNIKISQNELDKIYDDYIECTLITSQRKLYDIPILKSNFNVSNIIINQNDVNDIYFTLSLHLMDKKVNLIELVKYFNDNCNNNITSLVIAFNKLSGTDRIKMLNYISKDNNIDDNLNKFIVEINNINESIGEQTEEHIEPQPNFITEQQPKIITTGSLTELAETQFDLHPEHFFSETVGEL